MTGPLANPTDDLTIDFPGFIAARQDAREAHLVNGIPDYSFSLDRILRARISAVPALRGVARTVVRSQEPMMQQINLMNGIAVGPEQYPHIFTIGEHCARTLGIGTPRIFLLNAGAANAWTYASDDARPSIVITTRLLRGLTDEELTAIIGHECGHIHNLHSAYNTLVELLTNAALQNVMAMAPAIGPLALLRMGVKLLGSGFRLFMLEWSRAAEITCDRAGAICAGGVTPMMTALAKLKTAGEWTLADMNIDAYVRQLDELGKSPVVMSEFLQTHPMTQKRIAALKVFETSETLRDWGLQTPAGARVRTQAEVDRLCEEIVKVVGGHVTV